MAGVMNNIKVLDLSWGTIATDRQPLPVWSPDE